MITLVLNYKPEKERKKKKEKGKNPLCPHTLYKRNIVRYIFAIISGMKKYLPYLFAYSLS